MVTVALFGADEDSVLVRAGLRELGVTTTGAYVQEIHYGAVDLQTFLRRARPDVVIYDFVHPAGTSRRWLRRLQRVCARGSKNDYLMTGVSFFKSSTKRRYSRRRVSSSGARRIEEG